MKKKLCIFLGLFLMFGFGGVSLVGAESNASEPKIKPMAWYQFDDAENMGKDSMGKFDLTPVVGKFGDTTCLEQAQDTDDENYARFVSKRDPETGHAPASPVGAYLYAPRLGETAYDFSDLIAYSYTVELTFRRDNASNIGDHYVLCVGRYNNAFQITPWNGGIQVQLKHWNDTTGTTQDEKMAEMQSGATWINGVDTSEFTTITISADYGKKTATIYLNGEKKVEVTLPHVELTYKGDDYAFALGSQSNMNGGAATGFATVDIKDCKVFDFALSGKNVKDLYDHQDSVYEGTYVQSAQELDFSKYDLKITDRNTSEHIMREVLPNKVDITLSNSVKIKADVFWIEKSNNFIGYIQSQYANAAQIELVAPYTYTAGFEYDPDIVTITNVKLDGQAYKAGDSIDKEQHILSFKLSVAPNCSLNSVSWYEIEQLPGDDGEYSVVFMGGASIIIDASKTKYTVTYYDEETKLFTSEYTYGGSEPLKEAEKDGFQFDGWYTDAALTNKVVALNYNNPANINLYAKFTEGTDSGHKSGCGGCGGSVTGTSLYVALGTLALAALVFFLRR